MHANIKFKLSCTVVPVPKPYGKQIDIFAINVIILLVFKDIIIYADELMVKVV